MKNDKTLEMFYVNFQSQGIVSWGHGSALGFCGYSSLFFKGFYLFIFRERGREGEREGEKHQCVVASPVPPTGALA